MGSNLVLAMALGIGVIAGLRALTAPATVSWAAHLGWIQLAGSHLSWVSSIITAAIFTLAAVGEIVNDKLPKTPPRTAPPSIVIRMVMGAFAAATLSVGTGGSLWIGALLGAIGALIGTFGGYYVRTGVVKALHSPDWPIALIEDAVAICGGLFLGSRL
ncbi:MAG: DUF4126 family protein [Candidatus Acidiferrales bacterium]